MDNWIIFDVDDVLCNFRDSLYHSFKVIGKDIHWNQWTDYASIDMYGLPDEKALHAHMIQYKVLEKSQVEDGVVDALKELKKAGYKIGLLTARAWHKDGQNITENFVDKNDLCDDKIVISGFYKDKKSQHIDKFSGNICGYFDDSIHHIEDFITEGVKNSYLIDRPWNQQSSLPRVKNFSDLIKLMIPELKYKIKI